MRIFTSSVFFLLFSLSAFAQARDVNEAYALFIYRFTKMTEHPSSGDYKIVVFGNAAVASQMEKFHNSLTNGRKIVIVNTNKVEDTKEATLVFVGDSRSAKIQEVASLNPTAIIVTERSNLFEKGSNIGFLTQDNKIAFEVSKSNSEAKGIKLSKEILTYAKRVE